jgi:hypothetical protein
LLRAIDSPRREAEVSGNVVSLHGNFTPEPAEPNGTVVEELERLLEAARSGEIVGMAGSFVRKDGVVSYSFAGRIATYALIGGLECVKERLLRIALSER